jgi:hypothetical protein
MLFILARDDLLGKYGDFLFLRKRRRKITNLKFMKNLL